MKDAELRSPLEPAGASEDTSGHTQAPVGTCSPWGTKPDAVISPFKPEKQNKEGSCVPEPRSWEEGGWEAVTCQRCVLQGRGTCQVLLRVPRVWLAKAAAYRSQHRPSGLEGPPGTWP